MTHKKTALRFPQGRGLFNHVYHEMRWGYATANSTDMTTTQSNDRHFQCEPNLHCVATQNNHVLMLPFWHRH